VVTHRARPRLPHEDHTVRLDGDAKTLWKNWSYGLHRVTCYGDVTEDLAHFCRFMEIEMVDEARKRDLG
jgi:hypothetical protein